MKLRYASGVRLGALTIDPVDRVDTALWTHRPARRPPARRVLAGAEIARRWRATLALPVGAGAVAMGFRIELLPSGYGPGGAAVLLTRAGARALVVGPTTTALRPRHADQLALFAPDDPADPDPAVWLPRIGRTATLIAPDAAAAVALCDALDAAGLPHRRPRWLDRGRGPADASITVSTHGDGTPIDARPQAPLAWLVDFAGRVGPRAVFVHGPAADRLARALAARGHAVRVLHGPQQLSLLDDYPEPPFVPAPPAALPRETEGPERR